MGESVLAAFRRFVLERSARLATGEVADVIAFILSKAKLPAGQTELPADMAALKQIKYVAPKG